MMSYRTYVRYLYVILSEIPHIKFGMTHPLRRMFHPL